MPHDDGIGWSARIEAASEGSELLAEPENLTSIPLFSTSNEGQRSRSLRRDGSSGGSAGGPEVDGFSVTSKVTPLCDRRAG